MICDNCGFEHNSKSVCPKCGARVVYVDEEYLKRKKAWEEAQQKGSDEQRDFTKSLPPGIMFSSRDEGDNKPAPDEDTEEGPGILSGLSFGVIKDKIIYICTFLASHIKAFLLDKSKRRASKEKQDRIPKPRKLRRMDKKRIIVLTSVGVVALLVVITLIVINRSHSNSKILVYDGRYAYYDDDMEKPVWGSNDGVSYITGDSNDHFMVWGSDGVSFYYDNEENVLSTSDEKVSIITKDDKLNMVFFSQGDTYYVYTISQGLKTIDMPSTGVLTEETSTSENAEYFAFTLYDSEKEIYTLYEGKSDGTINEICSGSSRISILSSENDGNLYYLSMDTAEYGIINNTTLCSYDGSDKNTIASDIVDAQIMNGYVFYITADEKLYSQFEHDDSVLIASQVTAFSDSGAYNSDSTFIYETEDGYYLYDIDDQELKLLFKTSASALNIYYNTDNDYVYYTDMNSLYFVEECGMTGELINNLSDSEQIVQTEDYLLALDSSGEVLKLTDECTVANSDVQTIQEVVNDNGYIYVKDDAWYYKSDAEASEIKLSNDGEKNVTDTTVIYSDDNLYYIDSSNVLWKVSLKGGHTSLGTTSYFMLVK